MIIFRRKKIGLVFILILFLLFSFASFSFAVEIQYPRIPNAPNINQNIVTLPNYILYWFYFSIYISGILGLGVFIYGGLLYLTSAGNPARMADAKDKMFNAIIGIVIILASYLILNTINPQLVILNTPNEQELRNLGFSTAGIIIYDKIDCADDANKYHLSSDTPLLDRTSVGNNSKSLKIGIDPSCIDKFIFYKEENYNGESHIVLPCSTKGCCKNITNLGFSPKSLKIIWKEDQVPGIHIYANSGCKINDPTKDVEIHSNNSLITLSKTKSFKIIGDASSYYTIFHTKSDFSGKCTIIESPPNNCSSLSQNFKSVDIFSKNTSPWGAGIALFSDTNFNGNMISLEGNESTIPFLCATPTDSFKAELYEFEKEYYVSKIYIENGLSVGDVPPGETTDIAFDLSLDGNSWMRQATIRAQDYTTSSGMPGFGVPPTTIPVNNARAKYLKISILGPGSFPTGVCLIGVHVYTKEGGFYAQNVNPGTFDKIPSRVKSIKISGDYIALIENSSQDECEIINESDVDLSDNLVKDPEYILILPVKK